MAEYSEVIEQMRALAPALKSVSDETLTVWVSLAEEFVCSKRFGDAYVKALALYTMHLMFADGAMKSEKESVTSYSRRVTQYTLSGEFSMSYGAVSSDASATGLNSTPWGKMYKILNRKKGGGFGLMVGAHGGCR